MYGVERETTRHRIEELLEFFDLATVARDFVETYSKGMKQKLSVAAAIIHEPDLLILDEPLDGIDVASGEDITRILLQMNRSGVTIMITSHVLEMVETLCSDVAIVDNGRVVFHSPMDELERSLQMSDAAETKVSLRDVFLQITSPDRPHKTLSWLE